MRSILLHLASEDDLLHLKRIAYAGRATAADAQDIAFLEARNPVSASRTRPARWVGEIR